VRLRSGNSALRRGRQAPATGSAAQLLWNNQTMLWWVCVSGIKDVQHTLIHETLPGTCSPSGATGSARLDAAQRSAMTGTAG
jgi:hypothetical protein